MSAFVFARWAAGTPAPTRESDDGIRDDVPVADAAEQPRATADVPPADRAWSRVPLETPSPEWREQRETVLIEPEPESADE